MKTDNPSIIIKLIQKLREELVYDQVQRTWFDLRPVRYIRPNLRRW